jgi:type IV secretion system protein TrbL
LFFQFAGPPPPVQDPSALSAAYQALQPQWIAAVQPFATDLFIALATLDLASFGWSLWRQYRGDITAAILSTTNRLLLIGLFLDLLLNGPTWMANIVNMFITVGKAASGGQVIQPSVLLVRGFDIVGSMLAQALKCGLLADLLTGLAMVLAAIVVLISFLVITVEFVVTKIQTFIAMAIGLFFLGFGGSSWTRNYVERYFSYSVSSGVRLMMLYVLIGAGFSLSQNWINLAANAPISQDGVLACWVIGAGSVIYAMICWRGPAIAAGILGGGPNLSHNEIWGAISVATQAGVSAALIASGVGSAAGAGAAAGGGGAAAGGASMKVGATAPSGASGASAATGSHPTASGASQAAGAMQSASSKGNGKSGSGGGPEFGGLDRRSE